MHSEMPSEVKCLPIILLLISILFPELIAYRFAVNSHVVHVVRMRIIMNDIKVFVIRKLSSRHSLLTEWMMGHTIIDFAVLQVLLVIFTTCQLSWKLSSFLHNYQSYSDFKEP